MQVGDPGAQSSLSKVMTGRAAIFFLTIAIALLTAGIVRAVSDATLSIARVGGDGWTAEGVTVALDLAGPRPRVHVEVRKFVLASLGKDFTALKLDCGELRFAGPTIACDQARLSAIVPELGAQSFVGSGEWRRDSGALSLSLDAQVENLTASNEAGTLASDKLRAKLHVELRRVASAWRFKASVKATRGQVYAQPIFLDFGAHALDLAAAGEFTADRRLTLEKFDLSHTGVATARGTATVAFGAEQPLQTLSLDLRELVFPGAYESYLQPFLLDTDFKALKTAGRASGAVVIAAGKPQALNLHLENLGADDGGGKFLIDRLSGDLRWVTQPAGETDSEAERSVAGAAASKLHWDRATFLRLEFGPADFGFVALGRQFRLLEGARVALFDGAVHLDSLRVRNAGTPDISFLVDAEIEPVNVRQLCRAFGWPEFGGSIGGKISKLRMRDGVVTVGTALEAQVFDGKLGLRDVRLEDPFGKWPRFFGNVAFDDLDLALVTDAFSFGRITGKLSGEIANLQLFNWTPVAFEARLTTPPNDRSPHRISQRAVANIGNLGGSGSSVTAALSSGFLKFFQDFNYDRLGITCTLRNDVCLMGGVTPAQHGYYLVKGKGVPRIDVIGSETRVDWPRLVAQLIAITHSSGPVVQ